MLYDTTISVNQSRFLNNQCSDEAGAVCLTDGTSKLALTNVLFSGNWALNNYSDISSRNGNQTISMINVTIHDGTSKNNSSCYFEGQAAAVNCIFTRAVSWHGDRPLTANNCFAAADWSERGSNNITGDPKLTGRGYLLTGSPCIGAGTIQGAPAVDIDGIARSGSIDIGCQQFVDSDADGIPDNLEIAAGLNPADASDAALDKDADGLSNLQEYQLGTEINLADSDGDGISDGDEVAAGYRLLLATRIVYVDSLRPDDSGDGLSEATAKRTIKAAVNAAKTGWDNVVLVKPGRYSGSNNRELSFDGYNIKLRSVAGAGSTIIDLTDANQFLSLDDQESRQFSWLDGFTISNGNGRAPVVALSNAGLSVRNCIFSNHNSLKVDDYYYYGRPGMFYLEHADIEFLKSEITNCNFNLKDRLR